MKQNKKKKKNTHKNRSGTKKLEAKMQEHV